MSTTILNEILAELKKLTAGVPPLGFVNRPIRRRIYCNTQYPPGCMFFWNGATNTPNMIVTNAIECFIEGVEIATGNAKGKPNDKLVVHVRAHNPYSLVMGIETLTAKTMLRGLLMADLSQPLMLAFRVGDEPNVLFCDVRQHGAILRSANQTDLKLVTRETMSTSVSHIQSQILTAVAPIEVEAIADHAGVELPAVLDRTEILAAIAVSDEHLSVDQIRKLIRLAKTQPELDKVKSIWLKNKTGLTTIDRKIEDDLVAAERQLVSGKPVADIIAKTGEEMLRLGWDKDRGQHHLTEHYGKMKRSELTTDQLQDFLNYLKQQPTSI